MRDNNWTARREEIKMMNLDKNKGNSSYNENNNTASSGI
jgi:hypothetical protein